VTVYSTGEADFSQARAAYLGHFAERDDFEPPEAVQALEGAIRSAGREVTFHVYPGTGHWFAEPDRPDAYDADAAALVWERMQAFLKARLAGACRPVLRHAGPRMNAVMVLQRPPALWRAGKHARRRTRDGSDRPAVGARPLGDDTGPGDVPRPDGRATRPGVRYRAPNTPEHARAHDLQHRGLGCHDGRAAPQHGPE